MLQPDGRIRLADVADRAGVSVTTASFVLNPTPRSRPVSTDATRRVRDAAEELGYVANYHARSVRTQRADTLAVAIHSGNANYASHRLGISYFGHMIAGLEAAAGRAGYATILFSSDAQQHATQRAYEALRQGRVDGIIVPAAIAGLVEQDFGRDAEAQPIVLIDAPEPARFAAVGWDQALAVELAMQHLFDLGHRDFLWLGPEHAHAAGSLVTRESLTMRHAAERGYRAARCTFPRILAGNAPPDQGPDQAQVHVAHRALADWLCRCRPPRPTAIVAYNDVTAIGALRALHEARLRVPDDLSIVAFDNFEAPLAVPALTSIDSRFDAQGQAAVDLLADMIAQGRPPADPQQRFVRIAPSLVIRQSTAAPPSP